MATLIEDIKARLDTLAPAGGVWYGVNTTEPPTYPYIVFLRVINTPNVSLSGPSDLQNTRVQVDLYSRTVSALVALETALETAMAAWAVTNVPLSAQHLYESDVKAYRAITEYSFWAKN